MSDDALSLSVDFFSHYTKLSYAGGDTVIHGDQTPDGVYFLADGLVKLVALNDRGSESTLTILREPAIFPIGYLMTGTDNPYYYVAFDTLTCYRAPVDAVREFVETHPELLKDMVIRLSVGMGGMLSQMERLMHGAAHCRVVNILLILSERFGTEQHATEVIPLALTHPELAAMAGVSRETVTRLLNRWRDEGIVEYDRREIRLLDMPRLQQLC